MRSETHVEKGLKPNQQRTVVENDFRGCQEDSHPRTTVPTQEILTARIIDAKSPCQAEHEIAENRKIASNSTVISKGKKLSALLLTAAAVLPLAILDVWTRRQPSFSSSNGTVLVNPESDPVENNSQDTAAFDFKENLPKKDAQPFAESRAGQLQKSQRGVEHYSKASNRQLRGSAGASVLGDGQPRPAFVCAVIHEHALGSCRGRLTVTGESIDFLPEPGSKDAFSARLEDIMGTELGDRLKIKFRSKTYRFKSGLAGDKAENRAKLTAIYQQLIKLRAGL